MGYDGNDDLARSAPRSSGARADARFNLGLTLLARGRWEGGFRAYEARGANMPYLRLRRCLPA